MSVLLAHEKKNNNTANAVKSLPGDESDSSSDEIINEVKHVNDIGNFAAFFTNSCNYIGKFTIMFLAEIELMDSDEDDTTPTVRVGHKTIAITDINDEIIAEMTPAEKEEYIQLYQELYSHILD